MKVLCCVMFKNEEEILKRCLDSVSSIVDGYLLVDTGSVDRSIDIALNYTPDVPTVIFEDFVITKNKVLDLANDMDYDFILWMDADEFINKDDIPKFQSEIDRMKAGEYDMLVTRIQDAHNDILSLEYDRPRIWKNKADIRFLGPGIHEYIPFSEKTKNVHDIAVIHKHKTSGKDYNAMIKFYLNILHKYHEKDPQDIRCLFYLARTYFDTNDKECLTYYQMYRDVCDEINYYYPDEYYYTFYDEGRLYKNHKEFDKAIQSFDKAIEYRPSRAEAYVALANLYFYDTRDVELARDVLEKARDLKVTSDMILFVDEFAFKYKVLDLLSLVYWDLKEYKKGLDVMYELLDLPKIELFDSTGRIRTNLPWFEDKVNNTKVSHFDMNHYFDNIFLINLERRKDRWDSVSSKLDKLGIAVEKFRAYDGELLNKFVDKNVLVRRTGGYIGCLLSHLEVMKIALERGYERILILEDDIAIHKDIHKYFDIIMSEVERNGNSNWDILYLGHANFYEPYTLEGGESNTTWNVINNERRNGYVWEAVNSWANHAWCLNRRTMKFLLDYYEENGYVYELDRMVASDIQGNKDFKCLCAYPQLFVQNDVTSDNDDTGLSANHFARFLNVAYSKEDDYL